MSDGTQERRGLLTHMKTLGDVVRLWGVLLIALLAVLNPVYVKSWVRDAGIKKLLDVEFSEADAMKIEAAKQDLQDSRLVIDQLGENLDQVQKALRESQPPGAALPAGVAQQLERTEKAVRFAETAQRQLTDTLADVKPLAQKAATTLTAMPGTGWGVVFGGDADLASARWELDRAARNAEPARDRLAIFFRENSYRSVARYDTREQADDALARFRRLRKSAYVVPLDRWCDKRIEEDGFFRCG